MASGDVVERAPVGGRPWTNHDLALRPGMTATANIVTEEKHGVLMVPNAALRFTPPDVLAQENGARGGLFIPGVTRGNPFGRGPGGRGQGQGGQQGAGARQGQPGGAPGGGTPGATAPGGPRGANARPDARPDARPEARPEGGQRGGGGSSAGRRGAGGGAAAAGAEAGARGGFAGRGAGGGAGTAGRGGFGGGSRVWVLRQGKPEAVWVQTGATDGRVTEVVGGSLHAGDEVLVDVATTPAGGR
jgi:HlyD family secretion protein